MGETSSQQPVRFIDFQNVNTISNEKEQTITASECDPLTISDAFRTTCKYCGRIFISVAFLMKHIGKEHRPDEPSPKIAVKSKTKQYKCKVCNGMISSSIAYLSHLKMHAAKTPGIEIAKLRSEAFPSTQKKNVSKLIEYKDGEETEDSSRKFRKISLLRRSAQKDFKCDLCELSFAKKDKLRLHFKTHKLFLCDTCGVKFSSEEDFREHIEIHKPKIADRYINKPFRIEIENAASIQNIQVEEKKAADKKNNSDAFANLEVETESEISFVDVPIKQETEVPIIDIEDGSSSRIIENQEEEEARISTRLNLSNVGNENKVEVDIREENKNTNDFVYVSDDSTEETDPYLKVTIEKVLEDKNKMFVCWDCSAVFATKVGVTNHIFKQHPNSKHSYSRHEIAVKFQCEICKLKFGTKEAYRSHLYRHMSTNSNLTKKVCNICGYEFINEKMFRFHMVNHAQKEHEEEKEKVKKLQVFDVKDLKCSICEEQFNTNSMLMTHLKSAHMFSCKKCNKEFQTQENLKIHLKEAHRESKYICNLCGDHFSSQERIYEHMVLHKTEKTEKIHDQLEKPLRCKICHLTLKTMYSMKCHLDKHRGVKNAFACDKCDMKFDICSKLDEHRRKHVPKTDFDRPFVCTVCDSRFILETALKRHYLREHSTSVTNGKRKLRE